jgi:hypothetical protein
MRRTEWPHGRRSTGSATIDVPSPKTSMAYSPARCDRTRRPRDPDAPQTVRHVHRRDNRNSADNAECETLQSFPEWCACYTRDDTARTAQMHAFRAGGTLRRYERRVKERSHFPCGRFHRHRHLVVLRIPHHAHLRDNRRSAGSGQCETPPPVVSPSVRSICHGIVHTALLHVSRAGRIRWLHG